MFGTEIGKKVKSLHLPEEITFRKQLIFWCDYSRELNVDGFNRKTKNLEGRYFSRAFWKLTVYELGDGTNIMIMAFDFELIVDQVMEGIENIRV